MKAHPEKPAKGPVDQPRWRRQGERIHKLGISHRAAAREIGLPESSFSAYMNRGQVAAKWRDGDVLDRIDRYIKIKEAEAARGTLVKSAPLRGKFMLLGVTMEYIADKTGVDCPTVHRGIWSGVWPDEMTRDCITKWIEKALTETEGRKMITKISLSDEVLEHYGLDRDPFTNEMESADDIFDTKEMGRAEKKIMVAVDKSGWVAVTGAVGSGKSTLIKRVEARLAKRKEVVLVKPRTIEKQFLGASHVCDSILQDLGLTGSVNGTLEHKARRVGRALEESYREGRKVVILIDEAHLLRADALLALKRIYEFEIGFKKLLSIILVGQRRLANALKTNYELEEVSQRVDLYELGSLNGALGAYLEHKLARAGLSANKEIFDRGALKAMQERADTPLALNNVAAAAMIAAWDLSEKHVTADIIKGL